MKNEIHIVSGTINSRNARNFFLAIACIIGVNLSGYQQLRAADIIVPLRSPTKSIPYEPERLLRMTLHECKKRGKRERHEVTGRFVTFGMPMKFVWHAAQYDNQVPMRITLFLDWVKQPDGRYDFVSVRDENGQAPRSYVDSSKFRADITNFLGPLGYRFRRELAEAKASNRMFRGYRRNTPRGDLFWMRRTYCGFDVFERDHPRRRALQALEINNDADLDTRDQMNPPLNIGRVFGYPDGRDGYAYTIACDERPNGRNGGCQTGLPLNDYIALNYSFDSSQICQINDLMAAHRDLIEASIIEQRTVAED